MDKKVITRCLEDLSFVSKRFAGILELGASLKELETLLNQTSELTNLVEKKSKELAEIKVKNDELLALQTDLDKFYKTKEAALKKLDADYTKLTNEKQASFEALKAEHKKEMEALSQLRQDYMAETVKQVEVMKANLMVDVKALEAKRDKTMADIEKIKKGL